MAKSSFHPASLFLTIFVSASQYYMSVHINSRLDRDEYYRGDPSVRSDLNEGSEAAFFGAVFHVVVFVIGWCCSEDIPPWVIEVFLFLVDSAVWYNCSIEGETAYKCCGFFSWLTSVFQFVYYLCEAP